MPGIPLVSKLLLGAKLGLAQALYPLEPGVAKTVYKRWPWGSNDHFFMAGRKCHTLTK
jgi:hypothetical protein